MVGWQLITLLKTLISSSAVRKFLLPAAAGALLGGGGVYWIMGLRLDAARANTKAAEQAAEIAQFDLSQCRLSAQAQNQAIQELQERAEKAREAMDKANAQRLTAEQLAAQILRERTPADQDACTAARNAFAEELRRERSQ